MSKPAPLYGIAVFHNLGDVLSATPVARQLKMHRPDSTVVWYTSERCAQVLENNPHVDEVVALPGEREELDPLIDRLRGEREWTEFFTPAAYMNYDKLPQGSVFDQVLIGSGLQFIVPFTFVMRLTDAEIQQARRYWSRLPDGPKILVESQFFSEQSSWGHDWHRDLIEPFRDLDPTFVFTSRDMPPWFYEFRDLWPKAVWCREPFRLNAEFVNLCDAFIGVSSGISALSYSDHCRRDVLHIETTMGWKWGVGPLRHPENVYQCFSQERFKEALLSVAARMHSEEIVPDFSPRFPVDAKRTSCPACGFSDQNQRSEFQMTGCHHCGLTYAREGTERTCVIPAARPEQRSWVDRCRSDHLKYALDTWNGVRDDAVLIELDCRSEAVLAAGAEMGMRTLGFTRDPDVAARSSAQRLGIHDADFMAADLPEASADMIVAFHLLQDVRHPVEMIEKAEYALKPGGFLYLTYPNVGGVGLRVLEDDYPWFDDHTLSLFSIPSLRLRLEEAGFFVEIADTIPGEFDGAVLEQVYRRLRPGATHEVLMEFARRMSMNGAGEEVRVMCRKRGVSKSRVLMTSSPAEA